MPILPNRHCTGKQPYIYIHLFVFFAVMKPPGESVYSKIICSTYCTFSVDAISQR